VPAYITRVSKKEKHGAHYPVAVLCDKWEYMDNTFA
jgi:hypothetical protein